MKKMSDFIGLYPINKTLRFELKPIGRKLEEIIESVIIKSDIRKAEEYVEAKKIVDDFHKHFMELSLSDVQDEGLNSLLREFKQIYDKYSSASSKNDKESELDKVRDKLRVKLVELLTKPKNERCKAIYNNLFKKELIEKILPEWVKTEEEKRILESFKGYTTYFSGFHENRKNIYTSKPLSTSIGYRLVHQNLPKFIDNIHIYKKVKDAFGDDINKTWEQGDNLVFATTLSQVQIGVHLKAIGLACGIRQGLTFHMVKHREIRKYQITSRLVWLSIRDGNDKETSELLQSTLFCHFKEPLCQLLR